MLATLAINVYLQDVTIKDWLKFPPEARTVIMQMRRLPNTLSSKENLKATAEIFSGVVNRLQKAESLLNAADTSDIDGKDLQEAESEIKDAQLMLKYVKSIDTSNLQKQLQNAQDLLNAKTAQTMRHALSGRSFE